MAINATRYDANYETGPQCVVSPGEMLGALAGVAKSLQEAGASGMGTLDAALQGVTPSDEQRAIAQALLAAERPTVLLGHLSLAHPQASGLRALAGHVASLAGGTFGVLSDGANAAGAALAGTLPHRGPGGQPAAVSGVSAGEMLNGCDAFVLLNVEPELDCADGRVAKEAMIGAELVVALTAYRSEAMDAYADVQLPIAPFAETAGSYVNLEGLWQSVDEIVRPQGEARPAWRVLRVLGNALELEGFEYQHAAEIATEVRALAPSERPENAGKWREPDAPNGGSAQVWRAGSVPMYAVDPVVRRAEPLQRTGDAQSTTYVRMSAALAASAGIADNARVTVTQGAHSIELVARIDDSVAANCVLVPSGVGETGDLGTAVGPVSLGLAGGGD